MRVQPLTLASGRMLVQPAAAAGLESMKNCECNRWYYSGKERQGHVSIVRRIEASSPLSLNSGQECPEVASLRVLDVI